MSRDFLDISAATSVGVTGKDAAGKGKPADSSAPGRLDPDPATLLDIQPDNVFGSPGAKSALPARKDHSPARISFLRAPERPDSDRNAALEERRDPTRQPDRDDGSKLPGREEPRRYAAAFQPIETASRPNEPR